jgi:hypothetical protein
MNVECYLVVTKKRGKEARVVRVTQGRPQLEADEAVIRLQLDLPTDTFEAPLITVPIERRQIAVAIEVDEPL